MKSNWVQTKRDIQTYSLKASESSEKGVLDIENVKWDTIFEGTLGKVLAIEQDIDDVYDDGHVRVLLRKGTIARVPKHDLEPTELPDSFTALQIINDHEGSHCRKGMYQWCVKIHDVQVPEAVSRNFGTEQVFEEFDRLRTAFVTDYMETKLHVWYPWIASWTLSGHTDGWLVLHNKDEKMNGDDLKERIIGDMDEPDDGFPESLIDLAMDIYMISGQLAEAEEQYRAYMKDSTTWKGLLDLLQADKETVTCPHCSHKFSL